MTAPVPDTPLEATSHPLQAAAHAMGQVTSPAKSISSSLTELASSLKQLARETDNSLTRQEYRLTLLMQLLLSDSDDKFFSYDRSPLFLSFVDWPTTDSSECYCGHMWTAHINAAYSGLRPCIRKGCECVDLEIGTWE